MGSSERENRWPSRDYLEAQEREAIFTDYIDFYNRGNCNLEELITKISKKLEKYSTHSKHLTRLEIRDRLQYKGLKVD